MVVASLICNELNN